MLILSTDSLRGYSLDHTFQIIARAGLDGAEVSVRADDFDSYDADYLNAISQRHGVKIAAVSSNIGLSKSRAEKLVKLAAEVGASVVALTAPDLFDYDYKKWLTEEMRQLRKKTQMHIAMTNAPAETVLGFMPKYGLTSLVDLKQFPDLALDTSNVASRGQNLLEIYAALKENLVHVHLANAAGSRQHQLLRNGNLPLESLLTRLARDGYAGALSLKLEPAALGSGDPDRILENLADCKAFVEKYFKPDAA